MNESIVILAQKKTLQTNVTNISQKQTHTCIETWYIPE